MLNTAQRITMALMLALVAACGPKETAPAPKPTLDASVTVVKICVDVAILTRYEDHWCADGAEGYAWHYIQDYPNMSAELPAVGQIVKDVRGFWAAPKGSDPVTIPVEGAQFARSPKPAKS